MFGKRRHDLLSLRNASLPHFVKLNPEFSFFSPEWMITTFCFPAQFQWSTHNFKLHLRRGESGKEWVHRRRRRTGAGWWKHLCSSTAWDRLHLARGGWSSCRAGYHRTPNGLMSWWGSRYGITETVSPFLACLVIKSYVLINNWKGKSKPSA